MSTCHRWALNMYGACAYGIVAEWIYGRKMDNDSDVGFFAFRLKNRNRLNHWLIHSRFAFIRLRFCFVSVFTISSVMFGFSIDLCIYVYRLCDGIVDTFVPFSFGIQPECLYWRKSESILPIFHVCLHEINAVSFVRSQHFIFDFNFVFVFFSSPDATIHCAFKLKKN